MSEQQRHVEFVEVEFTSSSEEEYVGNDACKNEECEDSEAIQHPARCAEWNSMTEQNREINLRQYNEAIRSNARTRQMHVVGPESRRKAMTGR